MILTDEEKKMLDGSCGEGVRRAMEIIVTLAKTYDVERLVRISSAHLGATFKSHGVEGLEWIEEMVEQGARCDLGQVFVTLNPRSFDNDHWREIGFEEQAVANQERLDWERSLFTAASITFSAIYPKEMTISPGLAPPGRSSQIPFWERWAIGKGFGQMWQQRLREEQPNMAFI